MSEPQEVWSVEDFEAYRSHLCDFVNTRLRSYINDKNCRRIIVRAPVKSGKRQIVEYIAMRDLSCNPRRVHAFLTSWHRKADENQREELKRHNLEVFSIQTRNDVAKFKKWLDTMQEKGKDVVNHIDECDHGSGERQNLAMIWRFVRDKSYVKTILYSATPEEVILSGEVEEKKEEDDYQEMVEDLYEEGVVVNYIPPDIFCGPNRFLMEGLVKEALPFFEKSVNGSYILTEQGREIMDGLRESIRRNPKRNIITIRLSYSMEGDGRKGGKKDNKAIYQFVREMVKSSDLDDVLIIADKGDKLDGSNKRVISEKIDWSNKSYWELKVIGRPIIIVMDQTSSRSTEWACHDRIYATHDFRHSASFSILSQAQERTNHYEPTYGGFQPILIYGNVKTFQLSAGLIDYAAYLNYEWKKKKVDRRVAGSGAEDLYEIKNSNTNEIHSIFNERMNIKDANTILMRLGCYADMSISARVAGTIKIVPKYDTRFYPCDADTFDAAKRLFPAEIVGDIQMMNPFKEAKKTEDRYQGYLRGYDVFDYERDVKGAGWGAKDNPRLTVCYENDKLGVALRWNTGDTNRIDCLTANKSMYRSKESKE